ncbi:MAG TPA: prephenate dehydrogenase/arogenate dehydrogenase family protein [Quisquiliibacterium sp.]|nr:prephenate dehydrogenase/arogenate dehydrogenase family protein [Quisquiliibacterium sp.]
MGADSMAAPRAPAFRRVAVLGVGLIGGSFAATLRARGLAGAVVGFTPGDDARIARDLGHLDGVAASVAQAVAGADLVVLATPVPAMPAVLVEARAAIADDALITDCASTKQSVIAAARAALGPAFARFVPGHPIAGSERHGPDAARADLFDGCVAVVCRLADTDPAAFDRVHALWAAMGARPTELDPARHDAVFAEVSHWPHAVAFALCGAIAGGPNADDALRFAGAGLRDTTRIGASSPDLWADILLDNRAAVLDCARAFQAELAEVLTAIEQGDRAALRVRLEAASRWRASLGPARRR